MGKNKLTARDRINILLDLMTFEELDASVVDSDGRISVITGYGKIKDRKVFVFAYDFTVAGGSLSLAASKKICRAMDLAAQAGAPIIGLLESGGARIQEGVDSLEAYGQIFTRNVLYSGVIPQISVILGPCAGGAVYSAALTDFVFMVQGLSQMYITGPAIIKEVTHEEVVLEQLGGALVHSQKSGNCHFVAGDEKKCFSMVRQLLSFLPQNNRKAALRLAGASEGRSFQEELAAAVPQDLGRPYDMHKVIDKIADEKSFMEVHELFARNLIVGFARMAGRAVGIIAQQPNFLAGTIDIDASDKAARFIRFCDCFNIPLVTLIDVPGYLPGIDQEYRGIIRHGAKLLYAYAEATVPKVSVILRKAHGGAYVAMSSHGLRGDINYAWPTSEIAVMGPGQAINFLYKKEIAQSENPDKTRKQLINDYREKIAAPTIAAGRGYIDEVIKPGLTRAKIIKALEILENKKQANPWKKHGNIPL